MKSCATCAAYHPDADHREAGECHRRAQTADGWGRVASTDWCLEHVSKRTEVGGRATGKREIAETDKPTEAHAAIAQQLGINLGAEWAKFKGYCLAHGKRYKNFDQAFRNWLRNANYKKS